MNFPPLPAAFRLAVVPLWAIREVKMGGPATWPLVVNYVFPAAIILLAAVMMISHWRTWQANRWQSADEAEQVYQRRRFRRRMQTSALLALVGVALIAGQKISPRLWPTTYVLFWCGVMLMLFWVVLLAGADVAATRVHVGRLHRQRAAERSRLQAELLRMKRERKQQAEQSRPSSDD